ncbi:hypothetical protein V8J82_02610 [Gymnodinialimonas sp. 2305UL16-5]|uniref:hypothetical protein n=1 Tax=Gymnodinialimonas mytili TaxID=3126503 RepID=UPI00309DA229
MDTLTSWTRERSVVVHPNLLVAEDLRQLLLSEGAASVVTAVDLDQIAAGSDAIAFIEGNVARLIELEAVQNWLQFGTPIVVLTDGSPQIDLPPGIYSLEQPFRSEQVQALLQQKVVF